MVDEHGSRRGSHPREIARNRAVERHPRTVARLIPLLRWQADAILATRRPENTRNHGMLHQIEKFSLGDPSVPRREHAQPAHHVQPARPRRWMGHRLVADSRRRVRPRPHPRDRGRSHRDRRADPTEPVPARRRRAIWGGVDGGAGAQLPSAGYLADAGRAGSRTRRGPPPFSLGPGVVRNGDAPSGTASAPRRTVSVIQTGHVTGLAVAQRFHVAMTAR